MNNKCPNPKCGSEHIKYPKGENRWDCMTCGGRGMMDGTNIAERVKVMETVILAYDNSQDLSSAVTKRQEDGWKRVGAISLVDGTWFREMEREVLD